MSFLLWVTILPPLLPKAVLHPAKVVFALIWLQYRILFPFFESTFCSEESHESFKKAQSHINSFLRFWKNCRGSSFLLFSRIKVFIFYLLVRFDFCCSYGGAKIMARVKVYVLFQIYNIKILNEFIPVEMWTSEILVSYSCVSVRFHVKYCRFCCIEVAFEPLIFFAVIIVIILK